MIKTRFASVAIMIRSRRIGGARITSQHVSWTEDACGCSSGNCCTFGCVLVDDQVAVVPEKGSSAYFGTDKFSKASVIIGLEDENLESNDIRRTQDHIKQRTRIILFVCDGEKRHVARGKIDHSTCSSLHCCTRVTFQLHSRSPYVREIKMASQRDKHRWTR